MTHDLKQPDTLENPTRAADPSGSIGATRGVAVALLLSGAIGFVAAAALLIEKLALLENPFYVPSCTLNAVVSCGTIMSSAQAEAFGFPNPLIGIAAFPVLASAGTALLAGARVAPWAWWGLLAGCLVGLTFVHWLIWQSIFVIGALCPYCMVAWICTTVATLAVLAALAAAARAPTFLRVWAPTIVTVWASLVALTAAVGLNT